MRTPDPAAISGSRLAIVRAARHAVGHRPYRAVTLRDIASAAGVSAPLIIKYFGGKEQLFDVVASFDKAAADLFSAPVPELGSHLVTTLLRIRKLFQVDPLLRVVFAIGAKDERALVVSRFREQVIGELTEKLGGGARAQIRAELVVAALIGLGAMLSIDPEGPLPLAPSEDIVSLLGPVLQNLIDGNEAGA